MDGDRPPKTVPLEALEENATTIMNLLDLPLLVNKLCARNALTAEQLERLKSPAHSVVERTGYLLQYVRRLQQRGMDTFLQCLRESSEHGGHREIVALLSEYASDVPQRSPLLDVFETKQSDILEHLSFTTFVNKMAAMGVISVHENMDVHNPHRTSEENTVALIHLLQKRPGAEGLLKFIECLQADPNPGHETLCQVLLDEARAVTQQHPLRTAIPRGDQVALLQLERWREVGTPTDVAIREAFSTHQAKLGRQLQVAPLLPYLLKQHVVSSEDQQLLNQLPVEERAVRLVRMVRERGPRAMATFVECLKESHENRALAMLFEMAPAKAFLPKPTSKKTSKLAVLLTMDTFIRLKNDYEAVEDNMSSHNKQFEEHRDTLKLCLERLGFFLLDFGAEMSKRSSENIGGITASNFDDLFQENVVARCNTDAIVFIYVSGIQFPCKTKDSYSAAVLKDGASEVSRRTSECLQMKDISHWVELLPTSHITFLIDTHQSHIVTYGKQRQPAEVEIMEDPWPSLTSLTSGVVLFFARPDPKAMWTLRGRKKEEQSVFGHLTELFTKALVSWIRRGKKEEVSHRLFYESVSFHWHKKGRVHKLFVPAIQGDVDRSFLGRTTHPYQQVIRADLLPSQTTDTTPQKKYNLQELQVATGTMMGLIRGDELEVFHILCPEVRVGGRVAKAYPLSAIAEVKEEDRERFGKHLARIYEEEPVIRDGSTEFVFVKKRFPLHQREDFAVGCDNVSDSERETIRQYVRESSMLLSYAPKTQLVRLMVKKEGQFFTVEDRGLKREEGSQEEEEDIRYKPRARSIQHVKSVLEIMAWFKYIKFLRTQTSLSHFLCFLTCEKPLLSRPTLDVDYEIRSSSHVGQHKPSEAILQFSDDPKFWNPDVNDPAPTLEVVFSSNRVMTALEVRGDSKFKDDHLKRAVLNYRKLVFSGTHTTQQPQGKGEVVFSCKEPAMFVTLTPLDWNGRADFCIALSLHMSVSGAEGGKQRTKGVESLSVMHWQYLREVGQWRVTPEPSEYEPVGHLNLSHTGYWLQWSGKTNHHLTFDLGNQILLEKMEIACVPGTNPLKQFRIELHTLWLAENMPAIPSVWPFKYELPRPLVVSNLQLCPLDQPPVHLHAQLQLYGNREEKLVSVEENEILTLHFVNYTDQLQFVYLYYLEETGKVEFVIMDVVQPKNGLKKLLRAHLPQGYDPPTKQITDIYQVLVSPKKMYLEPIRQLGLHDYHTVHSYNLCSLGRRTDIGKDEQWYQYKFTVIVKKGSHREHH